MVDMRRTAYCMVCFTLQALLLAGHVFGQPAAAKPEWMAGVAAAPITPEQSMWMAGYAARDKPSEGKVQDLFAKALFIQDSKGGRMVIITMDLIGVTKAFRSELQSRVGQSFGIKPSQLLINVSHTHCGPELRASRSPAAKDSTAEREKVDRYNAELKDKLVAIVGNAIAGAAPAHLYYAHARAGFAMNRRLKTPDGYKNSPNPDGPVDHSVPVLRITDKDGQLRAILFGYACHNTTLSFYQFCGDYAGYAQEYLQKDHPGVTAMFVLGAGADQNPYPRRELDLAKQHGRALSNAVETALLHGGKPLSGPLVSLLEHVTLDYAHVPTKAELEQALNSKQALERRHAETLLKKLAESGQLSANYEIPVQVVRFGKDLALIAVAGEVVVDYSLRLKRELSGPAIWFAGYSNEVFGYLPSRRVSEEGGYEPVDSIRYSTHTSPWALSTEERVIGKAKELFGRTGMAVGE